MDCAMYEADLHTFKYIYYEEVYKFVHDITRINSCASVAQ